MADVVELAYAVFHRHRGAQIPRAHGSHGALQHFKMVVQLIEQFVIGPRMNVIEFVTGVRSKNVLLVKL